jgi:hypothetical protein
LQGSSLIRLYEIDASNATIDFCLRHVTILQTDRRKRNQFHGNVTLAVDLTAGLISLGLRWSRCCGGSQCCDFSSISRSGLLLRRGLEIPPPSARIRIAVFVEMNENVTTTGVYVSDVLMVDLDQSSGELSMPISSRVGRGLADRKTCSAGICNIKPS